MVERVTSEDESVTVTNPTGPTVDLSVEGGGSQSVLVQRTPLSSAQILGINGGYPPVVDAPGAGKAVLVLAVSLTLDAGATPYTDLGGSLGIAYALTADTTISGSLTQCDAALVSASDAFGYDIAGSLAPVAPAAAEDQPVVLFGNFSDGNGTAVVAVVYAIVNVA